MIKTFTDPNLYIVYAENTDSRTFLGLATGNSEDIKAYYDSRKSYGLILEPAKIVEVYKGYADQRKQLLEERGALQARINAIDIAINSR